MNDIDQRIVQLQLENGQFDKGVAASLKSIDLLKKGLNFDKSSKSIDNLQKVGKHFSLDGLAKNVEFVASKFTALGILGVTAMQRVSNAAIDTGKKIVSALTIDPIKTGLREYETQMNAIQTILSNTRSKGTVIDDVNEALDELNEYADKTIYNFTEMSKNIGTFTAAGIDLSTSTAAIKGIANLAAVSGSNSQQASTAMYQLSQALSTGTVRLMDWNSVVNAGMGGEVFQDALKETARVHGIAIDGIIKKEGSFRESLQNGWLSSEILLETLKKFTGDLSEEQIMAMGYTKDQAKSIMALGKDASDAATKVKTFTQLIDTLKEALGSGWTQSWENIIGNFEEARTLWTSISDVLGGIIGKSADARNDLLSGWNQQGGRADLIEGLTDVFGALWSIVVAVGDAMHDIFPETTVDDLLKISNGVKEFGKQMKAAFNHVEKYSGYVETVKKMVAGDKVGDGFLDTLTLGTTGEDVKKLQEQLKAAGYDLGSAGVDGIFGKKTAAALEEFKNKKVPEGGSLLSALGLDGKGTSSFEEVRIMVTNFSDSLDTLGRIARGVFAVFDIGGKVLSFIWDVILSVADLLSPIGDVILTVAAAIGDYFVALNSWLEESGTFTSWLENIKAFLKPVGDAIKSASTAFLNFFGFGEKADEANDDLQTFSKWWGKISDAVKATGIWQKVTDAVDSFKLAFADISPALKEYYENAKKYLGEKFMGMLETLGEKLPGIIESIGNFFVTVLEFLKPYIKKIPEGIEKIKGAFLGLFDQKDESGEIVPGFITKVKTFFTEIWTELKASEKFQNLVTKVKEIFKSIIDAIKGLFTAGEEDTGTDKPEATTASRIEGVFAFFEKVGEGLKRAFGWAERVFTWINDFADTVGPGGFIAVLASIFVGTMGFSIVFKLLKTIKGFIFGLGNLTNAITDRLNAGTKQKKQEMFAKSLFMIAASIAMIVGAMYVLGTMKPDEIKQGATVLGAIVGTLVLLTVLGTKFFKGDKADALAKLGDSVMKLAFGIGVMAAAIYILSGMDFWSLAKGIAAIGGLLFVLHLFMKNQGKAQTEYKGLIKMAAAVGILAMSVKSLGKMDPWALIRGVGAVIVLIGVLGGFMSMVNRSGGTSTDYKGLIGLGVALWIMVELVKTIGKMDPLQAAIGVGGLIFLMGALAAFMILVNKSGGSTTKYAGLIGLSFAIGILAGIAALLGKMHFWEMTKGIIGVSAIMFVLTKFMKKVNKIGGSPVKYAGLIAMSFAVGILAGVVLVLGGMEGPALVKGIGAVSALVGLLAGLAFVLGKYSKDINIASTAVLMGGLILMVVAFAFVMNAIKDIDPGVMLSFATSLAIALGALVAAVLLTSKYGGQNPIKNMATGAAGIGAAIAIIVGTIASIITALGAIDDWSDRKFTEKLESGGEVLRSVGKAFGLLLKGIDEGFNGLEETGVKPEQLIGYSRSIEVYGAGILLALGGLLALSLAAGKVPGGFSALVKGAAGVSVALIELSAAVTTIIWGLGFINQISNQGFIAGLQQGGLVLRTLGQAIGGFFLGIKEGFTGVTDIDSYTKNMEDYGTALSTFSAATSNITVETIQGAIDASDLIAKFVNSLPLIGGVVSWFEGEQNFSQFSTDLSAFAGAIQDFASKVQAIGKNKSLDIDTQKAISVASQVKMFFDRIADQTIDPSGLSGYNDVVSNDLFAKMDQFSASVSTFAERIKGIGESSITSDTRSAISNADSIAQFLVKLKDAQIEPNKGALDAWLTGSGKTQTVIDNIATLGTSMQSLKMSINGLGRSTIDADTNAMIPVVESIARLLTWISGDEVELKVGDMYLADTFTILVEQMGRLSGSISNFNTDTETVDTDRLSSITSSINSLITALVILSDKVTPDAVNSFETVVTKLASLLSGTGDVTLDSSKFLDNLDGDALATTLTSFTETVSTAMDKSSLSLGSYVTSFNNTGAALGSAVNSGIASNDWDNSGANALCDAILAAISEYDDEFAIAGDNLIKGLNSGLSRSTKLGVAAAVAVVKRMYESALEFLGIHSPSKKFAEIGKYSDEGLAQGLLSYSKVVTKAGAGVGNAALNSTKRTMSNLAGLVESNMDADPVIRPVMDLSNVTAGARSINGLLSHGGTVSVDSITSKNLASSINVRRAAKDQNGSTPANDAGSTPTPAGGVNITGNTFSIRSDNDIYQLASEIVTLNRHQQLGLGSTP